MVKRYRKKPVVVEALQWTGRNEIAMFDFLADMHGRTFEINHSAGEGGLVIKTLEGNHFANIGDYIIKGIKGEFYPCKPDIFGATYEEAEDGDSQ